MLFLSFDWVLSQVKSEGNDNCKLEFQHAVRQHTAKNMIPVVMEKEMKDTEKWTGPVGMTLGDILYARAFDDEPNIESLLYEIKLRYPAVTYRIKPTPAPTPVPAPVPAATAQ